VFRRLSALPSSEVDGWQCGVFARYEEREEKLAGVRLVRVLYISGGVTNVSGFEGSQAVPVRPLREGKFLGSERGKEEKS
jgi:hypothetical protein